jgi:uncharacterized protein (TIGR04255 family)
MFEPTDQRHGHAIREAVFALFMARPPGAEQLQRFIEIGKTLKELPAMQLLQFAQFPFLPGAAPDFGVASGLGGASFQSFKPDGTLSWRLLVQQNQVTVNCLDYESWEVVWPRAKDYLCRTVDLFADDGNLISSGHLQYINAFHWRGGNETVPDFADLLNTDSDRIPQSFWQRSSREWHLQQGWFENVSVPSAGRALHREHLASQVELNTGLTVMVDIMDRHDFKDPLSVGDFINLKIDDVFSHMRRRLRSALRSYLNEKVCTEIGAVALS